MPSPSRTTTRKPARITSPTLPERIRAAVRRSLNQPKLKVEVRRRAGHFTGQSAGQWRVRLIENRRTSEAIDLGASEISVVKKVGLIPPDRHGDLRIALAGIREDWSG